MVTVTPSATPTPTPTPESTTTSEITTTVLSTSYQTVTVQATSPAPSAYPTTFPSTGTFTIPAKTITLTSETTVCGATSTSVPSGTHTVGGVTTVVETSTTVICPYATVKTSGTVTTSVIEMTTTVCPSAGTYTIAPTTTTVSTSTILVVPTPVSYTPGTYTQPQQVVTVTETDYTYICPEATGAVAPPPPPSSASPSPSPSPSPSAAPAPAPAQSTSVAASPSPMPSSGGSPPTGSQLGNHSPYAMTFTGYNPSNGACMDAASALADLVAIKALGFHAVRIYSTDCNQLETIGNAAATTGLKMILGLFIAPTGGISSVQSQIEDITKWARWDLVEFISVDNEAILDNYVSASDVASLAQSAGAAFKAAGYTGQITLAEDVSIWQQYASTLCPAVDFISANVQAFFNPDTTADQAGKFVAGELAILKGLCPGKEDVFVSESGWPTAGQANGAAVPGVAEQITAVTEIVKEIGTNVALFSFADDLWKQAGPYGVEQYWGCKNAL